MSARQGCAAAQRPQAAAPPPRLPAFLSTPTLSAVRSQRSPAAVYPDGKVCISILHSPGDDPHGYEQASERWSPVQTVETILLSIISMLSCPNDESPANLDAAKQWREDRDGFKRAVGKCVRQSQEC